jgi:hypothetical protein
MINNPGDDASPWGNGVTGSTTAAYTTPARYACAEGYKSVSVMYEEVGTHVAALGKYPATIFKSCGISANEVAVPQTAADPAPYIAKALTTHPQLLIVVDAIPANTLVNAIASAHYPMSKVLMSAAVTSPLFSNPQANGLMFESGWAFPVPSDSNPDAQTYLHYMKQYSPSADPLGQLSLPAFQELTTIWQAAKAVGFSHVTGAALEHYMNTGAGGHLKVFAGQTVTLVPGDPGVKQPYAQLVRVTTHGNLDQLGWWLGYTACTSKQDCLKGQLPASS